MMKRILLLISVLAASLTLHAQNAAEARKVLDRAAATISLKTGAQAHFQYYGKKGVSTSGTISIKGNKFQAATPQAMVWYDGKTQWTYMKSSNEVNITHPSESERMQMNPYSFLTLYKKGYKLSMKDKGSSSEIHLVAQQRSSIPEMYIIVDKSTHVPSHVKFLHSGSWSTIVISGFKNKRLPNSAFSFNKSDFPHAEVIDLR